MAENKRVESDQIEKRSLGATVAAAAITGTAAGTANALAHHALDKLTGKGKSNDEPKKK
jgi:hypothetical protein